MPKPREIAERKILDKLWDRFIKFRKANEYRFPIPESSSGLPITPKGGVIGERLKEYLSDFFVNVLKPALGEEVDCQFLNLLLWDPFRPDSVDNWAMVESGENHHGVNNLGSKYGNYLADIEARKLSMFYLLYTSLRKGVLALKIPKDGLPQSITSYDEIIPRVNKEAWKKAKTQFRELIRVHGHLKSDLTDIYIYYIPSLFNPKYPGTGIGGLILISSEEFGKSTLIKVQAILDSVLSKIGVYYLYEFFYSQSLRSAISAIMARNMSHNIGSHVTPRATVHVVRKRLDELSLWPGNAEDGLTTISELKGNLDEYAQRKADFLAEITTQPLMTTRPAYFYREIIIPLIENSLMMDNIAANEGINYMKADETGRGGVSNRLQIHVRINGKSLRAVYRCKNCKGEEAIFTYPTALPYSLTCPNHKNQRLQIDTIKNGEHDIEVELPGPLGEFAVYSFLENYIRNVAKHNKSSMGPDRRLKLIIDIDEVENEPNLLEKAAERPSREQRFPVFPHTLLSQEQRDFYRIRVWDDIVDPDRPMNVCVDGQTYNTLQAVVAGYADASIIQPDGSLKRQAWGIGEMKICAILLSGPRNFVKAIEQKKLRVLKQELRGKPRMVYEFRLMKSKKICAVLPGWVSETMRLSLRDKGIWIYHSIAHLESEMNSADSISSFHFALFDCSESAGKEQFNIIQAMERILPHFPFRVLAFTGRGSLPSEIARLVQPINETFRESLLAQLHDRRSADSAAAEMYRWAWEHWIKWFLDKGPNAKTAVVNIYLDQWDHEQPTRRWAQQAERFNPYSENVKMRVWGRFEDDKIWAINKPPSLTNVPTHIIYDRHARLKDEFENYLGTNEDWSYVLLDKHSPDFTSLFTPRFPPLTQAGKSESTGGEQWTLPWEMAEAGLLRVLVIDERAAEFSLDELDRASREVLSGLLRASEGGKLPTGFNPIKWHLAWASKVYICTHFGINHEPEPLHDRVFAREGQVPTLKMRVDIEQKGADKADLTARVGFNIVVLGEDEKKLKADAILIHQGVLDEWRNNLPDFNQDAFLKSLRRHFPFVIVESGRGIPLSLSDTAKFLPFSLLQHSVLGSIVGKFGLARILMSLARRGKENYE